MDEYLKKYLDYIEVKGDYTSEMIRCEICNEEGHTIVREIISIGTGVFGKLPVVSCNTCGFLFQNPRFNKGFYEDFYSLHYRRRLQKGDLKEEKFRPTEESSGWKGKATFIEDQFNRGELLYNFIEKYLPEKNGALALLDVGSSAGGMLKAFINRGWDALGVDPDVDFVQYGKEELGLPVICSGAEEMKLEDKKYDLINIMGSLEHVYDPNKTLELCRAASRPGGLLLLEGRGNPQNESKIYFNHNHHRYFSLVSIELMMIKYGWEPILTTDELITGATRPGGIYCLGRLATPPSHDEFMELISAGKRELPSEVIKRFDRLDKIKGVLS